jgi:magnesium transporter
MNFSHAVSPYNMPELYLYYGYPLCLLSMFLLSLGVLALLWWKGWLGALSPLHRHHPPNN